MKGDQVIKHLHEVFQSENFAFLPEFIVIQRNNDLFENPRHKCAIYVFRIIANVNNGVRSPTYSNFHNELAKEISKIDINGKFPLEIDIGLENKDTNMHV